MEKEKIVSTDLHGMKKGSMEDGRLLEKKTDRVLMLSSYPHSNHHQHLDGIGSMDTLPPGKETTDIKEMESAIECTLLADKETTDIKEMESAIECTLPPDKETTDIKEMESAIECTLPADKETTDIKEMESAIECTLPPDTETTDIKGWNQPLSVLCQRARTSRTAGRLKHLSSTL
ncbi:hypothetical protein PRIPAC_85897 [Pristionchus pacificus]|uniref:Uncharacterized protein n=1 Tax=Pristionchus pacificus TaxID=54126 RepID=A0A2A6CEU6_PRIPA|nr:hypothetical protein PRIPAC_85897 [Pristionchus pacificus]|eukprot:PDM76636.1 hypothetical protein PRIPAC_43002 [Pristionchus pacificus]